MQRTIKFTHTGSSAAFGNFAAGDVLRCSAEAARHFVENAMCAQYDDAKHAQEPEQAADTGSDAAPDEPAAAVDTHPAPRRKTSKTR